MTLVEPGIKGCINAKNRNLNNIICASLQDIDFQNGLVGAIGAFDVVEHIEDDLSFLKSCHQVLADEGKLFITVPAFEALWSHEDVHAGHYRRYTVQSLEKVVKEAGFQIEYCTYFFAALVPPIYVFRSLASKLGLRRDKGPTLIHREHVTDGGIQVKILESLLAPEICNIERSKTIKFGSSCLLAAKKA